MFRSFVYVVGLSIALVGCGDGSGGSGGSGASAGTGGAGGASGMGGTGGSGGLPGDACLDDIGILAEIEDIPEFVTEQCLLGSRGCALMQVPSCVAECLDEEIGLPQDCGLCIGLVTECILEMCITDCTAPDSMACSDCVADVSEQCNEVFEPCAGFIAP